MRIDVASNQVERALQKYLAAPGDASREVHSAARRHGVLPLWSDMGGCLVLRPDGEILTFGWDTPGQLEDVSSELDDRQLVHAARVHAASHFPDIDGLRPVKPHDAVVCPGCHGAGRLPDVPENVVCMCGGAGWMPPDLVAAT